METALFVVSTVLVFALNYDTEGSGNAITNAALAAFIVVEVFACLSRRALLICKPVVFYCLFVAFCMVSILWSADVSKSLGRVESLWLMFAYFLALTNYVLSRAMVGSRLDTFLRVIVIASIVAAVYLLATSDWQSGDRVNEVIGDSNQASMYLSYSIPVSLHCSKRKLLPKWVAYGQIAGILASILVMASRTGLIIAVLGIMLYWLIDAWQEGIVSGKNVLVILLIVVGCYALYQFVMTDELAYELIGRRFESLFDILRGTGSKIHESSYYERQHLFNLAVSLFLSHPIAGVGIDAYAHYAALTIRDTFSHNDFVQLLSCVGILGTALYYSQHVYLLSKILKTRGATLALSVTLLVQILMAHWFVVFYYQKLECVFIALLSGVVLSDLGIHCGGIYLRNRSASPVLGISGKGKHSW